MEAWQNITNPYKIEGGGSKKGYMPFRNLSTDFVEVQDNNIIKNIFLIVSNFPIYRERSNKP